MDPEMELSCAVSIPANKEVTSILLLAQRGKEDFFPVMTIDLSTEKQILINNDSVKVFRDCRVTPNLQQIRELDVNCCVKMKFKRGKKTVFKRALDATLLIHCLKEPKNASKAIHIDLDAFSPNPISITVKENVKEEQKCKELNIAACSSFEPQLPQRALEKEDSVKKDSISEVPTFHDNYQSVVNSQMDPEMKLSCAVSIPANKEVTSILLLAQRGKKRWWWKKHFFPIMTVDLRTENQILINNDSVKVFRDCRVTPNLHAIRELDVNCCVKIKFKKGKKTIFKRALDATLLIHCLKEPKNASKAIHIDLDAFSPNPVSITVKENVKEEQECEELNIAACSSFEPQLPQEALEEEDSVKKDSIQPGKVEIKAEGEICHECGKRELPRPITIPIKSLPPVPEMPSPPIMISSSSSSTPVMVKPPWAQYFDDFFICQLMHAFRVCMRRLCRCAQTKTDRVYARHKKPIKRIWGVFNSIFERTYPGRVEYAPGLPAPLSLPVTNRLPSLSSDESASSTTECQFPLLKSVARVLLRQKARGVCRVYCTHKKFVPRKMKIEVKSFVFNTAPRYRKLITFNFDKRWNLYKEKKIHFIERDRQRNSLDVQSWTSEKAAMLLNRFMRHKDDTLIRVTVKWDHNWRDGPSRSFLPMSWFSEQVWEDVIYRREFVVRIWTQEHLSSQQEDIRALVWMKNSLEENVILAVDDEPLISNEQESEQEEAKCKEEQLVFNGEECREKETKEMTECELNDSNKEERREEGNEDTPNNSEEDKEASKTSEKGQEDQKTDREGEGSPAAAANTVIADMVKRVKRNLVKVVWVALTVVGVLVAADALLPDLPED